MTEACLRASKYINNVRTGYFSPPLPPPVNLATNSSGGREGGCAVLEVVEVSWFPADLATATSVLQLLHPIPASPGTSPVLSCPALYSPLSTLHSLVSATFLQHNYIIINPVEWRPGRAPAQWVALYSRLTNSPESRVQVGGGGEESKVLRRRREIIYFFFVSLGTS